MGIGAHRGAGGPCSRLNTAAMARSRIQPLARDLQVIIDQDLSPDAQGRALAAFAKTTLAETQDQNRRALGRVPPHRQFVDGTEGRSLDSVKPTSRITFEFELLGDVVEFVLDLLRKLSPILTGAYRAAHVVFVDGQQVDAIADIASFEEIAIVNTAPYARRIEAGISKAAPEGVYQAAADAAAQRFGNIARVRFTFRSVSTSRAKADRQPAIVIVPR